MELFILIWLPLCIAAGLLARRYDRSVLGWFIFSLLLSPMLGFIFLLACGPRRATAPVVGPSHGPDNDGLFIPTLVATLILMTFLVVLFSR